MGFVPGCTIHLKDYPVYKLTLIQPIRQIYIKVTERYTFTRVTVLGESERCILNFQSRQKIVYIRSNIALIFKITLLYQIFVSISFDQHYTQAISTCVACTTNSSETALRFCV